MKKIITLAVVLIVIFGGYFAVQYFRNQQRAVSLSELQTVTATRGSLTATVGATGSVRPNQTVTLYSKPQGRWIR